jgi:hypothetical protein
MLAFLLANTALAAGVPPAQPATDPTPKRERLICRRMEQTGTRMSGREVCRTQSQWDYDKTSAEDVLRDKQLRDVIDPVPLTPPVPQ